MYKTNDEIIKIQAKATTPIPTGVVFWSHDKGTAKLRFELLNGPVAQNIAEGSKVPIRLEFVSETAEGGKGKHDYLATIEDRVNGMVSIVLADNIMGYVGTVTGSIYIDFPNSTSIDTAGRFTFEIRRSPIDENTPEVEDYFFNGWSEIQKKLDEKIELTDLEIEKLKIKLDNLDKKTDGIKATQETILKSIADNELVTKEELEQAKQESSANVINQISGAESAFAKKEFLVNGVEGTGARENNDSFTPFSPEDYASLVSDTGVVRVETLIDGRGAESEFQFPLINIIGERYPDFFEGLSTIAEKITRCKDKIRKVIVPSEFRGGGARYTGTGSVSNYSRLYIKNISNDNGGFWGTTATNSTASYRAFNTVIDATSMKQIQPDGSYVFKIVTKNNKSSENGIVSDGTTAAWIEIKDLRLIVEIEMNGRTLILSMMATYSGENSVSLIGNQSIAGVKNFLSAPMVDGKRVATIQDLGEIVYVGSGLTTIQSDKRSSFDEFVYQFRREGNEVRFFGRVKVKDATAITNSSADLIVPPIGFGMASNLKNSVSGVTLDTSQWTLPQGNYIGLLVNDGGSTPIKFSSNKTGNVYISGSWPTDEAWPT